MLHPPAGNQGPLQPHTPDASALPTADASQQPRHLLSSWPAQRIMSESCGLHEEKTRMSKKVQVATYRSE
eukprot:165260-Pelagomonas_calceolata.AAC.3